MPEHHVLAEQEHNPQRESRIVLSPQQGIRHHPRRLRNRYGGSARRQTQDGARPERHLYGKFQEHGAGFILGTGRFAAPRWGPDSPDSGRRPHTPVRIAAPMHNVAKAKRAQTLCVGPVRK